MKFTCEKSRLAAEIATCMEVISNKNIASILSNVSLSAADGKLEIKATDTKVNYKSVIPVTVLNQGETTVLCDKFLGIINGLDDGEIEFELIRKENMNVAVIKHTTKKIKYQLKCMNQELFPVLPDSDGLKWNEISCTDIRTMISQTNFAVALDENRYYMNGIYLDCKDNKFVFVSTDGKRLSICSKENNIKFTPIIVNPKALNIFAKKIGTEGNIQFAFGDKCMFLKSNYFEISASTTEGKYPDYNRVIPQVQSAYLIIDKNELSKSLKRLSQMVDRKDGKIVFNFSENSLKLNTLETEFGDAEIELSCEYSGKSMSIALNYRFVDEPLKVIQSDNIRIEFTDDRKPVTIQAEPTSDYKHVVMPMQM